MYKNRELYEDHLDPTREPGEQNVTCFPSVRLQRARSNRAKTAGTMSHRGRSASDGSIMTILMLVKSSAVRDR